VNTRYGSVSRVRVLGSPGAVDLHPVGVEEEPDLRPAME
jgi:hypothetical protein